MIEKQKIIHLPKRNNGFTGFVMIESDEGVGCLNIKTIVAIKPRHKMKLAQ